ncbi:MAG: ABC transporter ATP-binding protein [Dehalococcoidia bacterium]|nr:ABC transporter ATP-binding protein [Dehalococcoidia bacterium]
MSAVASGSAVALRIRDLTTVFRSRHGVVRAVDGVTLDVRKGEMLGIVGESGSGKSMLCLSIMRLVPGPAGRIEAGSIELGDVDLLQLKESDMRAYRGRRIAVILQDPLMSLNPVYSVGNQMGETLRIVHPSIPRKERLLRAVNLLRSVRIPEPEDRLKAFPHQLSGGMRQRVCAAIALSGPPEILLADEPTTALDVTTQAEFLRLLRELRDDLGVSIVLVTHDLGIVAQNCDRVAVMYAGRIIEEAPVQRIYTSPAHPYTASLLRSVPSLEADTLGSRLVPVDGSPPDLSQLPGGCRFAARCPLADAHCHEEYPPVAEIDRDHRSACWKPGEVGSLLEAAP